MQIALLEPAEYALDAVALLIEAGVIGDQRLAVRPAGDTGRDPEAGQGLAEPVAVVEPFSAISTSASGRSGSTVAAPR